MQYYSGVKRQDHGLNIGSPPRPPPFQRRSPNPHWDGLRRRGLWEVQLRSWGWSPHSRISAIRRRGRDTELSLCPEGHSKKAAACNPGRGGPHQEANLLAPGSWASHPRTMRNKRCVSTQHPVREFVPAACAKTGRELWRVLWHGWTLKTVCWGEVNQAGKDKYRTGTGLRTWRT